MASNKEINETLQKILNSKTFSKATTTTVLLKYLVESTLQQKEISAYTIGCELFGKKYDPEKSDVNIRVNISHLRKRLQQYYNDEGSQDSLILFIKPGQYQVTWEQTKRQENNRKAKILIPIIVVIISIAFLIYIGNKKNDHVWGKTFKNGFETTLYLGDVFGYNGPSAFSKSGWHRDASINSAEQFYDAIKEDPEKYATLTPGDFNYVVIDNAYNIKPITRYFTQNKYDFSIRPSTDFVIRSLKERNTIYAGPLYTQNTFTALFNELATHVILKKQANKNRFHVIIEKKEENKKQIIDFDSRSKEGEYTLASAFNGPNNTRHHLFFSNHMMGLNAVIDQFCNKDSLAAFSKKHLKESDEFIALFFVKGKDRTSLSTELVFVIDNQ